MSLKIEVPVAVVPTRRAVEAFGNRLPEIGRQAFLEIGRAGTDFALHHHQFQTPGGEPVAIASRVRASGLLEVEVDVGLKTTAARTFTTKAANRARKR